MFYERRLPSSESLLHSGRLIQIQMYEFIFTESVHSKKKKIQDIPPFNMYNFYNISFNTSNHRYILYQDLSLQNCVKLRLLNSRSSQKMFSVQCTSPDITNDLFHHHFPQNIHTPTCFNMQNHQQYFLSLCEYYKRLTKYNKTLKSISQAVVQ